MHAGRENALADDAVVGGGQGTEVHRLDVGLAHQGGRIRLVGGGAENGETGGLGGVVAAEFHVLAALADVEALAFADLVAGAIDVHPAGGADVERAQLAALEEIVATRFLAVLERERLRGGNGTADHQPVAKGKLDFDGTAFKKLFHQELLANLRGRQFQKFLRGRRECYGCLCCDHGKVCV